MQFSNVDVVICGDHMLFIYWYLGYEIYLDRPKVGT